MRRAKKPAGFPPGFLAALGREPPKGAFPLRLPLRHGAKIRCGAQETGFSFILRHGFRRSGIGSDAQLRQQIGHSQTFEMG